MSTDNTDTGDTTVNIEASAAPAMDGPQPREALITTAVNFLQNAKVRHATIMQKQQYLRSKGLTSAEIQLACDRAGVFSQDPNKPINVGITAHTHTQMAMLPQQSAFSRIKDILQSMALLSGVAYSIYMFWKKYLAPFLFGAKKKKPIEDSFEEMNKKVDARFSEVNQTITQVKEALTQQTRDQAQQFMREFNHFRTDLESIKGLLLNRKQFASPLTASGPPSIPAWQLSSSPHHRHRISQSDDNEKADDAGSGSGSSETEVVTKNSDSSLEIM